MTFQTLDISRLIGVAINQTFVVLLFSIIAYYILKRNRTRLAFTFASFFLFEAVGFAFGIIYLHFKMNPLASILYFIAIFCIFFGPSFLLVSLILLLKTEVILTRVKQAIILIINLSIFLIILIIPGVLFEGFQINSSTVWRPQYSLSFFIVMIIYITIEVIPILYFSLIIYKKFEFKEFRRRWFHFLVGIIGFVLILYGLMIYILWSNEFYRLVWSFVSPLVILFGVLIYQGIGRRF
jgi:hypothetical protein